MILMSSSDSSTSCKSNFAERKVSANSLDAEVWLLLSNMPCTADGRCLSRTFMAHANKAATSVSMTVEQLHAGEYKAMAVLDLDKNLTTHRAFPPRAME